VGFLLIIFAMPLQAQSVDIPRTADGKPDFSGIWQATGSSHYEIEPHSAEFGPRFELGAIGAIPGGLGIVEGGEIPYTAAARQQQIENKANGLELDPVVKCYMPGIPRATYLPFPFQKIQSPEQRGYAYEFARASRNVYVDQPEFEFPIYSWMGHSLAHFEGDTLVIEVTGQGADTWFDHAGNHHTEELTVTERYTHMSEKVVMYEATLDEPNVYTEPWKVSFPLYRRVEENMQLLENKGVEITEELINGHLRKQD
jgi:hypothetical protein